MAEASSLAKITVTNVKFEVKKFDELDIALEEKPDKMVDKEWAKINRQACVNLETDKSLPTKHHYGTRAETKVIDQRLERLEQLQREMQDQLQMQMHEQLAKIQQDMTDQMLESQRNMMNQLTQLLNGGLKKGKTPMANAGDDNEDPLYPLAFTPTNAQTQPELYSRRPSVTISPQQFHVGASAPMNNQKGSGSNMGDNPTNLVVPNLDDVTEIERARVIVMKNADYHRGIDAEDLSLVSDLVLSPKFKMLEFKKYNGTSCPEAHITMF
ncbi:hypothetical protein J1N35_011041 [Gossypium stocksii]|uniref:Uncharacterized protein n=1 Tax=Gossypium stocksii TaxID=47602 RepID=A0A9D3W2T2_9ROSI|nr:hypothetical protein J1N35_011041 [Gossypium stocksii]